MLYNGQNVNVRAIHTRTIAKDVGEGVVVGGWSQRYVSQGRELCVVPATVQGEVRVRLTDVHLVLTVCVLGTREMYEWVVGIIYTCLGVHGLHLSFCGSPLTILLDT